MNVWSNTVHESSSSNPKIWWVLHQHSSRCHTMIMFRHAVRRREASMLGVYIFFFSFQNSLFVTQYTLISWLFINSVCIHSVAAFAAMRVVSAAWNAPVVAVRRLPNFQETFVKFMFHHYCCMKWWFWKPIRNSLHVPCASINFNFCDIVPRTNEFVMPVK